MKFNIVSYAFLGKTKTFDVKEDFVGGEEIYLYDLAKLLIKNGHDVTVIQASDRNSTLVYQGIKIKTFNLKKKYAFNFLWKKHIEKDADRIHLHDFESAFPLADSNMTGTCHGVTWDYSEPSLYWAAHNIYHKFMAKEAIKLLGKIASVDSSLLKFAKKSMHSYQNKIKIIHSYAKTDVFKPDIRDDKTSKLKGRRVILFPRNLTKVRGVFLILEAMKTIARKIPDSILMMTGTGPLKSEVENFIASNKLKDNVILVGHKNHLTEMPKLYTAADVVVIPSLGREGCSLSCLEAMATKKPVVVTNVGGLGDIVANGINGISVEPNAQLLANSIIQLLEDRKESNRIAKNGYKNAKGNFNYELWCKRYLEFFGLK